NAGGTDHGLGYDEADRWSLAEISALAEGQAPIEANINRLEAMTPPNPATTQARPSLYARQRGNCSHCRNGA
ncbi:MAG TPA: hypothetical protein VID72_10420, partial [Ktedonobacterales bacterium]